MAQYLTVSQARAFEIGGREYDIISLIEALERTPDGWVSPATVSELSVGQIVHVWALGDRLRRGVVAKLGRTKATVVFTTQGALDDAIRHGQGGASIRVADTAVQLSQIKIPAPAAPVATEEPAEDLTLDSQDCKVEVNSEDEPEGDEMSTETTEVQATETDKPASAPPVTGDMTGSAVVKLMEEVWERIRENHPELPAVVIVTGTAFIGPARWGHFRANGWKARAEGEEAATNLALGEMFMAGETLAKGARQVLETMLHEGAHVLARVRDLKDTSRQGRWHNKTFKAMAEELGLEHKRASADAQHGFSFVTLTAETEAKYADLLDELDREIRLVVDLPSFWGTGQAKGDEDEPQGGEFIGGGRRKATTTTPQSGNLKATCGCAEPNIIRASRKVLDLGVIRCDECEELFTAA
jgi:hypothetical protein